MASHITQSRTGRVARPGAFALAPLLVLGLASCSGASSDDGGGESSDSCAFRVDYADVTYSEVADLPSEPGTLLGKGMRLGCDDSQPEPGQNEPIKVYRVPGLDPDVAIASGASPGDLHLLQAAAGKTAPAEINDWLTKHR